MRMTSLLERLKNAYAAAGLDCGDALMPPARVETVANLGRRLGIRIPPQLQAVWRVHGGQRYVSPGITGLFGDHRLHSPSALLKNYRMFCEYNIDPSGVFPPPAGEVVYFHPRLLPFASWDIYNLCIDSKSGEVWQFSPNYGICGGTSRDSIASVVQELLVLLQAGRDPAVNFITPRTDR
jgi:cell wall assembly regulator SMI1